MWRNEPDTYRFARNATEVSRDEHSSWFDSTINSSEHLLLICQVQGERPAAVVRFDLGVDDGITEAEVSITVDPQLRGQGLGIRALTACEEYLSRRTGIHVITAFVLHGNLSSSRLFSNAGYVRSDKLDDKGIWFVKNVLKPSSSELE